MAEMLHNILPGCPCGSGRTRRRESPEVEPIESESQTSKRRKTAASTLNTTPAMANPVNTSNRTLPTSGGQQSSVLAIPHLNDTIQELSLKLSAIAKAMIAGESIATATAFSAAAVQERIASKKAVSEMPPMELVFWTAFTNGTCQLPEIDWDNHHAPPSTSPKPLKIARRRAEALNQLYKTDRAHEGHVAWITQNRLEILPLIKTMARVIGSERNLVGGRDGRSPTMFADLQSINKILSTSEQICQGRGKTVLPSDIPRALDALRIKRHCLRHT